MRESTLDTIRSLGWTGVAFGGAGALMGVIVGVLWLKGERWPVEMSVGLLAVGGMIAVAGYVLVWWTERPRRQGHGFTPVAKPMPPDERGG